MKKTVSIIVPAFNEEELITIAYKAINDTLSALDFDYEIIFVDDGSNDNTYSEIENLVSTGATNLVGVSFSRNFGKEAAIFAGLREAKGDCCIVMDCDLQHPPASIPEMLRLWSEEGFEVVQGVKITRGKEGPLHRMLAKFFYWLIGRYSKIKMDNASDFMLLDRAAVDSLLIMPEHAPFFRGLSRWIGYKTVELPFEVADRTVGTSKWSITSLYKYAIHNIIIFSARPLQIVTALGLIFIFASIFIGGEALYTHFTGQSMEGFTTVIILILLSSGIIMMSLGIIGLYIAQIYDEIKARPRYIVSKRCGTKEEK